MENSLKKRKILFGILFFIFLFALVYVFPYSGDDWAWGSSIGIGRLHTWFADYNGRYLGNLLVLVLTRSLILKTAIISLVLFGIAYLTDKFTNENKKGNLIFYVSALILLAMPRGIMMQGIVWTAGFSNYVPPIFLILIYLIIVNNIFKVEKPKYSKILIVIAFVLAICAALFMEHVTLYSIVLGFFVLIYSIIKFRKVYGVHIAYFIGSIIGAVIMFSNGAYGIIASNSAGSGAYRSVAKSSGLLHTIYDAVTGIIYQQLSFNNIVINILLAVTFVGILYKYIKKYNRGIIFGNILGFIVVLYPIYTIIQGLNPNWVIFLKYTDVFQAAFSIVFYIALIIGSLIFIEDNGRKAKVVFLLLSLGILTGPLFVVNPIGPRCFFPMYVVYMLIIGCFINELNMSFDTSRVFSKIVIVATIGFGLYLASVYGYIGMVNHERLTSVEQGIKANATEIVIPQLPYDANCNYVWTSYPQSFWMDRFKLFYKIPEGTKVKVVSYGTWKDKYKSGKLKTYN